MPINIYFFRRIEMRNIKFNYSILKYKKAIKFFAYRFKVTQFISKSFSTFPQVDLTCLKLFKLSKLKNSNSRQMRLIYIDIQFLYSVRNFKIQGLTDSTNVYYCTMIYLKLSIKQDLEFDS